MGNFMIFGVLGVNLGTTGISTALMPLLFPLQVLIRPIAIPYPVAWGRTGLILSHRKQALILATATNSSTLPPKIDVSKNLSSGTLRLAINSAATRAPGWLSQQHLQTTWAYWPKLVHGYPYAIQDLHF